MIEVDGKQEWIHSSKREALAGPEPARMKFRGIELVAVAHSHRDIRCEACAVFRMALNLRCGTFIPFYCSGAVFMRPEDAVTYKLTGASPNDPQDR